MYMFWLVVVIFLGILEAITINLVSIWFVVSGLIALVISLITDNFIIQFGSFVVIGIILLVTTRKYLESKLVKKEKTNLDRVVGMRGIITEEVDMDKIGEVKVDGKKWSCVSDKPMKVGEKVRILKIDGVKLKVESWEE